MPGEWRGWGRAGGALGHWPGFPGLPRWMLTLARGRSGVIGGASSPRRRRRRHGLIPHRASPEPSGPVGCCLRDWEEEGTRQGQGVGAAGAEGSWSCPGLGMCLCWGGGLKPREWQSLYFPCEAGEAVGSVGEGRWEGEGVGDSPWEQGQGLSKAQGGGGPSLMPGVRTCSWPLAAHPQLGLVALSKSCCCCC